MIQGFLICYAVVAVLLGAYADIEMRREGTPALGALIGSLVCGLCWLPLATFVVVKTVARRG